MPPKRKGLESAPIFKGRTRSIPRSIWQTLTVRTEGQELNSMLEDWGASDILSNPVITAVISARDTTGRITGSRFVLRGPVFVAGQDNPLPATEIWPEVEEDISVRFTLDGTALNLNNRDARNASIWLNLRTLASTKMFKGDRQLSSEEMDAIPAIKEGAAIRVSVSSYSTTHMIANLWAVPMSLKALRDKARDWKIMPESLDFPAINLTSHFRYAGSLANTNLTTIGSGPLSPQSASAGTDHLVQASQPTV